MGCGPSSAQNGMAAADKKSKTGHVTTATIRPGEVDMEVVRLSLGEDSVEVHLWGATLTSWKVGGDELILVSSDCLYNNKKALRGGIPVVFPNFGPWELGPQHGFARTSMWKLGDKGTKDGTAFAVFELQDSEATRAMWDFQFELKYTVTLSAGKLTLNLNVENKSDKAFDFTSLLHTYLRVADISKVTVSGLQSLEYIDKVKDGEKATEAREVVDIAAFTDRVYIGALKDHTVTNVGSSRERTKSDHSSVMTKHDLVISKANFPDTVVWNPWAEKSKTMGDLGDDNYKNFLCVEAGAVASRVDLASGATWLGSQTMTLSSHL